MGVTTSSDVLSRASRTERVSSLLPPARRTGDRNGRPLPRATGAAPRVPARSAPRLAHAIRIVRKSAQRVGQRAGIVRLHDHAAARVPQQSSLLDCSRSTAATTPRPAAMYASTLLGTEDSAKLARQRHDRYVARVLYGRRADPRTGTAGTPRCRARVAARARCSSARSGPSPTIRKRTSRVVAQELRRIEHDRGARDETERAGPERDELPIVEACCAPDLATVRSGPDARRVDPVGDDMDSFRWCATVHGMRPERLTDDGERRTMSVGEALDRAQCRR